MTEHKTMNTVIHAAFRRDLRRFDEAFKGFPAGSNQRAAQLGSAWDNLAFQLHHHHEDEETIFWPMMSTLGTDESLIADLKGEHAKMLGALDAAVEATASFRADPCAEKAGSARAAVAHLESVVTEHLAHEERDLEPEIVQHLGTPQMKDALKRVRKAHKGNAGTFFAWLLDGADPDAAHGLRQEVPPPVLFVFSRIGGRRYNRTIAPVWA